MYKYHNLSDSCLLKATRRVERRFAVGPPCPRGCNMGFGGASALSTGRNVGCPCARTQLSRVLSHTHPFAGRGKGEGKGGGKGKGGGGFYSEGPPDTVVEMGIFQHSCEGDLVVKSTNDKVRYSSGGADLVRFAAG